MHPRIAARRCRLMQAKLAAIAMQVEDLAQSLVIVAGETCNAEALKLAGAYSCIGMSLRSGTIQEDELKPFLKCFRLAVKQLAQIVSGLDSQELQVQALQTLLPLLVQTLKAPSLEYRRHARYRSILASGFDQVSRQNHLVSQLKLDHRDDALASDLLCEMHRSFLLISESCTLMKKSLVERLEWPGIG